MSGLPFPGGFMIGGPPDGLGQNICFPLSPPFPFVKEVPGWRFFPRPDRLCVAPPSCQHIRAPLHNLPPRTSPLERARVSSATAGVAIIRGENFPLRRSPPPSFRASSVSTFKEWSRWTLVLLSENFSPCRKCDSESPFSEGTPPPPRRSPSPPGDSKYFIS